MSAHELPPTGRGSRVKNTGTVGSVEKPKQGLAEWMGCKPGKHHMLPLYPPGDRRNASPTETPRSDTARTMRELREQRIAEREAEERHALDLVSPGTLAEVVKIVGRWDESRLREHTPLPMELPRGQSLPGPALVEGSS